jgi:hypothetical protein
MKMENPLNMSFASFPWLIRCRGAQAGGAPQAFIDVQELA